MSRCDMLERWGDIVCDLRGFDLGIINAFNDNAARDLDLRPSVMRQGNNRALITWRGCACWHRSELPKVDIWDGEKANCETLQSQHIIACFNATPKVEDVRRLELCPLERQTNKQQEVHRAVSPLQRSAKAWRYIFI